MKEIQDLESQKRTLLFEQIKSKSVKEYFQEVKKRVNSLTPEETFNFYHFCIDSVTLNYDAQQQAHSISIDYAVPIGVLEQFHGRDDENS